MSPGGEQDQKGKGSNHQDANSGSIHDGVMDPQLSSASGSACE